jgi:hypothetical protein
MLAYIAESCDRRRRNDFHPFGKKDGDRLEVKVDVKTQPKSFLSLVEEAS